MKITSLLLLLLIGLIGNLIVDVIGAFVGGFLFALLGFGGRPDRFAGDGDSWLRGAAVLRRLEQEGVTP